MLLDSFHAFDPIPCEACHSPILFGETITEPGGAVHHYCSACAGIMLSAFIIKAKMTGNLYRDDDPKADLAARLERAKAHYQRKTGLSPVACYVNPAVLPEAQAPTVAGLKIIPHRSILPNYYLLSQEAV